MRRVLQHVILFCCLTRMVLHFLSYVNSFSYGLSLINHCTGPVSILVAPGDMHIMPQANPPTVAVQCVAMGMPHPHITWHRNSHALTDDSGVQIQEDIVMRNELELVVSTLLVCPSHVRGSGGQYTCEAQNQFSRTEASFAVSTPGEPGCTQMSVSQTTYLTFSSCHNRAPQFSYHSKCDNRSESCAYLCIPGLPPTCVEMDT